MLAQGASTFLSRTVMSWLSPQTAGLNIQHLLFSFTLVVDWKPPKRIRAFLFTQPEVTVGTQMLNNAIIKTVMFET